MKAKTTRMTPLVAAAAAIIMTVFTPAKARAEHNALQKLACDLEALSEELVFDYTNELKYSGRWAPCGVEKQLFDALNTAAACAEQIHQSTHNQCGFEELNRHVCETRTALNTVRTLVHYTRVPGTLHWKIAQTDRLLSAVEGTVAARAAHHAHHAHQAHRAHRGEHPSQGGFAPAPAPAPVAPVRAPVYNAPAHAPVRAPATVERAPRGRVTRTDDRGEAFRTFIGQVFQDRRRR